MITLNSITIAQPKSDGVKEELLQIYHDRMRVNGSLQRNFFGVKKQVTLSWPPLAPADFQVLIAMFTSGATVSYSNSNSAYAGGSMNFVGLPLHAEDAYLPGSSILRTLTVTLRQV
ncbi:hypothetical protein [Nakamurella sp. PAMC28650]|uniref:hypothetical protein n=1 Tax=Nakamurella sp. PAMC28650 TaxID=2762325 RepID=UPI00164DA9D2|nr:hypothetical protein [Nakamurella sp. PAMC28650]QNK82602.1 hypothetical protein H7F38_07810 [Nakamurella sp. PAMC28650]